MSLEDRLQEQRDYYENELEKLRDAIREHRNSWLRGDDKCWKDNEELYRLLPEGFTPPKRDTFCELKNCIRYVESCHNPSVEYVSPQRRIEELEAELRRVVPALAMRGLCGYSLGK